TGIGVERSSDGGKTFTQITSLSASSTSYSDTGLTAGATYYYRVRALGSTPSGYSNAASATTQAPATPPPDPSNVTANDASARHGKNYTNQVTVRWWDNASNETGYGVQRSTNGGGWVTLTQSLAANATSYVDKSVVSVNTYTYRVWAFNGAGSSNFAFSP